MSEPGGGRMSEAEVAVLLADDQELVRTGLRMIIDSEPGLAVVAEAQDGAEAVALVSERRPDVVLMDIAMPRLDGIDATRRITTHSPRPGWSC